MFDKPFGYKKSTNPTLSKYSILEAWTMDHLAKVHSKFSGSSASSHMFLLPELHRETCSFPDSVSTIHIGEVHQYQCLA